MRKREELNGRFLIRSPLAGTAGAAEAATAAQLSHAVVNTLLATTVITISDAVKPIWVGLAAWKHGVKHLCSR